MQKTCNRPQARETGAKRGKTGAKRGKMCVGHVTIDFGFAPDWLKT